MLERRYRPLCRAIVHLPLRFAEVMTPTYTDGRTLFVSNASSDRERCLQIVVQCLLLRGGSLDKSQLINLVGKPERARRYLTLEVARVVREAPLLPRLIIRGSIAVSPVISLSPQHSLELSGDRHLAILDEEVYGTIRPVAVLWHAPRSASGKNSPPGSSKADAMEAQGLGDDEEADDIAKPLLGFFSSVLNIATPWARFFQNLMQMRATPGDSSSDSGGGDPGSARGKLRPVVSLERRHTKSAEIANSAPSTLANPVVIATWRYPEWDMRHRQYRENWCSVHEIAGTDITDLAEARLPLRDPWLERGLRQVALDLERLHRQDDGDDLDFDAVIAHAVELERTRRLGGQHVHKSHVYSRLARQRPNFAVQILLDNSGSACEQTEAGRRITDLQNTLAEMLAHSFTRVIDRVAALAFHGLGRDGLRMIRFKHFDRPWSHAASANMRALQPSGYTRTGAALRHAAHNLYHDGGCARRLLLVISDGHPFDDDYAGDYAEADVRVALREIAEQSIRVLWVCIGNLEKFLDDSLREYRHESIVIEPDEFNASRIQRPLLASIKQLLGGQPIKTDSSKNCRTTFAEVS